MRCTKTHPGLTLNAPEPSTDDTMQNESWLFRILSRATAFGEVLPQQTFPNDHTPTTAIINSLSRVESPEPFEDAKRTESQARGGCSIQRWLAFRASTVWNEENSGMSLAGSLEKEKGRFALSSSTYDFVSTIPDRPPPSTDAEIPAIHEMSPLTYQEKMTLIVNEFGSLAKENEEEQLLTESDASFFQDVAILGVVHLTTHRLTFHASLLNTRPDLASFRQILYSGYVNIRCGRTKQRHRVWMELMHDMLTTYRSSAEDERIRPLRTLLFSSILKVHPADPLNPLQVKIDSISPFTKTARKGSHSFLRRLRNLSKHYSHAESAADSSAQLGPLEILTHVFESGTIEAALGWRKELLAALYLFSKSRDALLGNFDEQDSDSQKSDLESERGVRISIPLEKIKASRMYQWDFASVLQIDISMLSGRTAASGDIPLGSPLLPKPPLPEDVDALKWTESPLMSEINSTDGDEECTPTYTRFQFALSKADGPWLRFHQLVGLAQGKRPSIISGRNNSPVIVDFGALTFVEDRVPLFDKESSSVRPTIVTESREREARRLFGLGDELEIWIIKCCRYRHTMRTTGLLIVSRRFICFWSRLVGTADICLRYHTEDLRSVSMSRASKFGFGLDLRIAGHADLLLDFSKSHLREEAYQRINALMHHNSTNKNKLRRMSSLGKESTRSSPFFTSSRTSENSMISRKTSHAGSTTLLSPISRTVSHLQARTVPPALIPHLAKPINVPINIPFGVSPRHFVLLTIGSRGDVQPYIALGKGLLKLGHRVTLVTHEEYKHWIEGYGINHRRIAGDPGALMKLNVDHKMFSPGFFKESLTNFRGWIDELLILAWEHCRDADVLIESPSAMAGVHIAEALKIPYFRAFTMPWSKTAQFPHPFISPPIANHAKFNIASYILFDNVFWLGTSGQINKWRKKYLGLPATDMSHLAQEKVPFLYNFSPSVVPKPTEWDDQITISGYWFLDNPELNWTPSKELLNFMEQARTDNKPLVYIGFGSITVPSPREMTKNIVKAVLKSDVRAILSKGWSSRMYKENDVDVELPPQIFLIEKAPHDWLFAQMTAVVHHGGAGTTGASLRAGVPTIIKPWFGDQFFWASRVQRLGVGLRLSNVHPGELAEALKKATTDVGMQEKAGLIGERIRAEDGVTTAIKTIYTYLDRAGKDRTTL